MSDNGIVWEEPPPTRFNPVAWAERLRPLMERPGDWARVYEATTTVATSTVSQLRQRIRKIPPGRWEFVSRASGDGHSCIYARYLGPEDGGS